MAAACQVIPTTDAFAQGVIGYLDCQAQAIGVQGYLMLAAPGSTISVVLTAMLTLLVALFGYRMLLGQTPSVRDGVLTFVRIGIVLALAINWPAYQVLVYDVVMRAPAELAASIGGASGLPGATGGLPVRLDGVDRALSDLAILGVGSPPVQANGQLAIGQTPPALFLGFDTFALGASRVAFMIGAIGVFALLRLAAGLLLALGPLFVAFLLFDGTRGLFVGWLRGLIGVALGALGSAIVLGVELALFEPWVADLLTQRNAGLPIQGVPEQLLAMAVVFLVALGGVVAILARVAMGLSFARGSWADRAAPGVTLSATRESRSSQRVEATATSDRSRAMIVADAVAATQRREGDAIRTAVWTQSATGGTSGGAPGSSPSASSIVPLGQQQRRRTATRVSASSGRRDRRA